MYLQTHSEKNNRLALFPRNRCGSLGYLWTMNLWTFVVRKFCSVCKDLSWQATNVSCDANESSLCYDESNPTCFSWNWAPSWCFL